MDLRRVRRWDWLAGVTGVVLIGAMFLHWYGGANAWEAFSVVDVFLLIAGLFGVAILVMNAVERTTAMPQGIANLSFVPTLLAAVLVAIRALDPPVAGHREAGLWIGLAAALLLLVACWNAMNDKRLPRAIRPHIEAQPTPEAK